MFWTPSIAPAAVGFVAPLPSDDVVSTSINADDVTVIVFDDADIDGSVQAMADFKFRHAGQVCIAPTRFLVQNPVADAFKASFVKAARSLRVWPGTDPTSEMGPLANDRRIPALNRMVADAVDRGARLLTGGRRIGNEGNFFEPTVLSEAPTDAEIMNEEPFGPVMKHTLSQIALLLVWRPTLGHPPRRGHRDFRMKFNPACSA